MAATIAAAASTSGVVATTAAATMSVNDEDLNVTPKTTTTEVSFPSKDGSFRLYGDLTLPGTTSSSTTKKVPAVLFLSGSGPIDRYGNVPGFFTGFRLETHRRFAQQFSCNMAVLSYDKRGIGKSTGSTRNQRGRVLYDTAGADDLVEDAVQAVLFLANHPQIDDSKLVVMGHSEGAILLPWVWRQANQVLEQQQKQPIKGCIFLSGIGEDIYTAMALQRERVLEEVQDEPGLQGWVLRKAVTKQKLDKQYNDLMEKIFDDPKTKDMDAIPMYCGMVKLNAKWFRTHKEYKAQEDLVHVTCDCLAITGQKDIQVRASLCEQSETFLKKAKSVEHHEPENLTHLLRSTTDKNPKLIHLKQDYPKMGKQPLDSELMGWIEDWCQRKII